MPQAASLLGLSAQRPVTSSRSSRRALSGSAGFLATSARVAPKNSATQRFRTSKASRPPGGASRISWSAQHECVESRNATIVGATQVAA